MEGKSVNPISTQITIRRDLLILLLAIAARLASPVTSDVSFIILASYALLGRVQAIQALTLSWLCVMINPGLAPEANATIGRFFVLFAAAFTVASRSNLFRKGRFANHIAVVTTLFGIFIAFHAVFVSQLPDISIAKTINWILALTTLLSAWSGLTLEQSEALEGWLFGLFTTIVFASLLFINVPEIGYRRNGLGFQGILNHPQVFGSTMAVFSALMVGRSLESKKPSIRLLSLLCLVFALLLLSETRTAGLAFIFGIAFSISYFIFFQNRKIKSLLPALRGLRFKLLLLFVVLLGSIFSQQLFDLVDHFITKSGRADVDGLWAAYQGSRAVLFEPMLANISAYPLTGIGFGISSFPDLMEVTRDPIFGLPLGASIEKGSAPLIVLEELGIPGFVLFVFWILALLRCSALRGVRTVGVLIVILLINLGEGLLFSPGGMGMLILILLSWAVAKPLLPPVIRNSRS